MAGVLASVKRTLDKPLTSYHLVLGVSALLLSLGLLMVLSASSVTSLRDFGNSYTIFFRQAIWVAIGLPMAWVASRLPISFVRGLAWPGLLLSCAAIAATYVPGLGVQVNGNQNWLSFGGFQIQPSEFAKLALVLWCADVYARKGRLLRLVGTPGHSRGAGLRSSSSCWWSANATSARRWCCSPSCSECSGSSALRFASSPAPRSSSASWHSRSSPPRRSGWPGWPTSPTRSTTISGRVGRRATASSRSRPAGSGGAASARAPRNGVGSPGRTPTTSSRSSARSSGCSAPSWCSASSSTLAYAGIRIATRTTVPFVKYASAGIVVWLMCQTLINVGMVLGLLPVIGIPLPLISYGGSALLPTLISLGLLLSFARTEPGAEAALRARRKRRRRPSGARR